MVTDDLDASATDTTWVDVDPRPVLVCTLIAPEDEDEFTTSPIELRALVTSASTPVAGATVTFYVDGSVVESVQSDSEGYAICEHTTMSGDYQWSAHASKTEYTAGDSSSRQFTFNPPPTLAWANYLVITILVAGGFIAIAYLAYRRPPQ
jgi:hypothetical protein